MYLYLPKYVYSCTCLDKGQIVYPVNLRSARRATIGSTCPGWRRRLTPSPGHWWWYRRGKRGGSLWINIDTVEFTCNAIIFSAKPSIKQLIFILFVLHCSAILEKVSFSSPPASTPTALRPVYPSPSLTPVSPPTPLLPPPLHKPH